MNDIIMEWSRRAAREGVTAVMSTRHSEEENHSASGEMKRNVIDFIERNYSALGGKRVLELGCGIGRFTRELALRAGHVTSVDMTPEPCQGIHFRLVQHILYQ